MLKSIETLCHISIKSQILYLSNLNLKPQYDSKNEYHYLTQNDLGLAINTGSQLSSHSTSNPTLNFLTYIPTSRNRLVNSLFIKFWIILSKGSKRHQKSWSIDYLAYFRILAILGYWVMVEVKILPEGAFMLSYVQLHLFNIQFHTHSIVLQFLKRSCNKIRIPLQTGFCFSPARTTSRVYVGLQIVN